jgi:hypothetical protein
LATGRILYGPGLSAWVPYWCATATAAAMGFAVFCTDFPDFRNRICTARTY